MSLAGCSGAGGRRPLAGSLTIVQTQDFSTLDPIYVSGVGGQELAALLYSYLVRIDDRGRLVPDAALVVPSRSNGGIARGGTLITYHLRPNLRFSDGTPLTSRDVAYTIRAVNDPRNAVPSEIGFDDVIGVETPDALTVRIRLRRPYAAARLYLCGPGNAVPILPQRRLRSQGPLPRAAFNAAPVGSGPYRVARWVRGERLELQRNPYYRTPVGIDRLTIRFAADASAAETMLRAREADAYVNADESQYALLLAIPGTRVKRRPIDGTGALIFNVRDPILRDRSVRRALALAFDAPQLVRKVLRGAVITSGPGAGLFQWAYDPRAFAMPGYDPRSAARLLDAAGWRVGSDGIRRKAGRRLAVTLVTRADKPSAITLATAIQAAERGVGVAVAIRRYPIALLMAPDSSGGPLYGGRFGMTLLQFIAGFDPDVADQFSCDRIPPHGFNKARYCNPRVDALLADGARAQDRATRRRDYRAVQRILARDLPLVALYQATSINVFPARLRNQRTAVTTPFWNVATWRLDR
jgi:peptide/nickel transport system substrate-binding protein